LISCFLTLSKYFELMYWFMSVLNVLMRCFFGLKWFKNWIFWTKDALPQFCGHRWVVGIWVCKQHVICLSRWTVANVYFSKKRGGQQVVCPFKIYIKIGPSATLSSKSHPYVWAFPCNGPCMLGHKPDNIGYFFLPLLGFFLKVKYIIFLKKLLNPIKLKSQCLNYFFFLILLFFN
jgi:hypothetical protein